MMKKKNEKCKQWITANRGIYPYVGHNISLQRQAIDSLILTSLLIALINQSSSAAGQFVRFSKNRGSVQLNVFRTFGAVFFSFLPVMHVFDPHKFVMTYLAQCIVP